MRRQIGFTTLVVTALVVLRCPLMAKVGTLEEVKSTAALIFMAKSIDVLKTEAQLAHLAPGRYTEELFSQINTADLAQGAILQLRLPNGRVLSFAVKLSQYFEPVIQFIPSFTPDRATPLSLGENIREVPKDAKVVQTTLREQDLRPTTETLQQGPTDLKVIDAIK